MYNWFHMVTTINISLPKKMYKDAKKVIASNGYSSMSELVRSGLRVILYPNLTVNGFTPEFEDMVLKSAAEPIGNGTVLETDEDVENYFLRFEKPKSKTK
jgi:hypothetical protein